MKIKLISTLILMTSLQSFAAPSNYVKCSIKLDEMLALSVDHGIANTKRDYEALDPKTIPARLDILEQELYEQKIELAKLRTEFINCIIK